MEPTGAIDRDYTAFKNWVAEAAEMAQDKSSGRALLIFLSELESEAAGDQAIAVLLRRLVAASVDDAERSDLS